VTRVFTISALNRPAPLNGNSFAGLPTVKTQVAIEGKDWEKTRSKKGVSRAAGLHGLAYKANRLEQQCVMPKDCDR